MGMRLIMIIVTMIKSFILQKAGKAPLKAINITPLDPYTLKITSMLLSSLLNISSNMHIIYYVLGLHAYIQV